MTLASGLYGVTWRDIADASGLAVNFSSDSIKLCLVTDAHTPDFNAHDLYADVTNEQSGSGYTSGGNVLDSPTYAIDTGYLEFDTADESWTSVTITNAEGGIGHDSTLAGGPLLWCTDLGAPYSVTGGTFQWQVATDGHFRFDIIP